MPPRRKRKAPKLQVIEESPPEEQLMEQDEAQQPAADQHMTEAESARQEAIAKLNARIRDGAEQVEAMATEMWDVAVTEMERMRQDFKLFMVEIPKKVRETSVAQFLNLSAEEAQQGYISDLQSRLTHLSMNSMHTASAQPATAAVTRAAPVQVGDSFEPPTAAAYTCGPATRLTRRTAARTGQLSNTQQEPATAVTTRTRAATTHTQHTADVGGHSEAPVPATTRRRPGKQIVAAAASEHVPSQTEVSVVQEATTAVREALQPIDHNAGVRAVHADGKASQPPSVAATPSGPKTVIAGAKPAFLQPAPATTSIAAVPGTVLRGAATGLDGAQIIHGMTVVKRAGGMIGRTRGARTGSRTAASAAAASSLAVFTTSDGQQHVLDPFQGGVAAVADPAAQAEISRQISHMEQLLGSLRQATDRL